MSEATINARPNLAAQLDERGIAQEAAMWGWREFEFHYGDDVLPGWSYPVFDLETETACINPSTGKPVLRWKNFDKRSYGGENSAWVSQKSGCWPYYVIPGTKEAILAADGLAYIAATEMEVLTYKSAGILNSFCWLMAEGRVPQSLSEIEDLLGFTKLIYFVDRDEAGEKSAQALMKIAPFVVSCYRLPMYLSKQGNINDLWQRLDFNASVFREELVDIVQSPGRLIMPQR